MMKFIQKQLKEIPNIILILIVLSFFTSCGSSDSHGDSTPYGRISGDVNLGEGDIDKSYIEGTLITAVRIPEANGSTKTMGGGLSSYTTVVDSMGKYLIKVPVGKYSVVAEGAGLTKAYGKVDVTRDATIIYNFTLTATATLRGQIDHPDFGCGMRVMIKDTHYIYSCDTNSEFVIKDLPVGLFIVTVYNDYSGRTTSPGSGLNNVSTSQSKSLPWRPVFKKLDK